MPGDDGYLWIAVAATAEVEVVEDGVLGGELEGEEFKEGWFGRE